MDNLLWPPARLSAPVFGAPTRSGILIIGQSNAGFFIQGPDYAHGMALTGLEGVTGLPKGSYNPGINGFNAIDAWALPQGWKTLTAAQDTLYGTGGGAYTTVGGTPLYKDGEASGFLADNGGDPSTWEPAEAGRSLHRFLRLVLTSSDRAAISAVFWLHTEDDSKLHDWGDRARYLGAVTRFVDRVRSWVGKTPDQLPFFTALPMPYGPSTSEGHRMIRDVFYDLATDPGNHFHIGLRQTSDAEPRGGTDYSHIDTDDMRRWARRISLSISRWWAGLYGTQIPANVPSRGPAIIHAWAESPTTTVLTVSHDTGTTLRLGGSAGDGRGWSIIDSGVWRSVTGCAILSDTSIRITHPACTGGAGTREVGYCLYGERVRRGNAIYDNHSIHPPLASGLDADYWGGSWLEDMPLAGTLTPLIADASPYAGDGGGGGERYVSITPNQPGTIEANAAGDAIWNITVTSAGDTAVEWLVMDSANVARTGWNTLTGTASGASLAVPFRASGDYVILRLPGDSSTQVASWPVTVTPYSGGGTPTPDPYTITLSSYQPGTLAATVDGWALWTVTVTTAGGDAVEWAVFTADSVARSGWNTLSGTLDGESLTVRFMATGDYLQVRQPGNDAVKKYTIAATVTPYASGDPIEVIPTAPGTVTADGAAEGGGLVTFDLRTNGVSRVSWVVAQNNPPFYTWRTASHEVDTASGTGSFTARFVETGDFLKVWDTVTGAGFDTDPATVVQPGMSGAAVASASSSAQLTGGSAVDLGAANFLDGLTLGVNVERGWAWAVPGGPGNLADYLRGLGHSHVRLFYPWRPTVNMLGEGVAPPTKDQFGRLLDAVQAYAARGMRVLFDCTDVLAPEDFGDNTSAVYQHIANAAGWIAERNLSPSMVAVGPVNEWAGGSVYTEHQLAFHQTLRAALPKHALCLSDAEWGHWGRLIASGSPYVDDRNVIWCHHAYEVGDAAYWEWVAQQLRDWKRNNGGRHTLWCETGLGYASWTDASGFHQGQESDPAAWAANLATMFPAMAEERATPWAITYGGGWRLNNTASDITIRSSMLGPLDTARQAIAAALPALFSGSALSRSAAFGLLSSGLSGDGPLGLPPLPTFAGLFGKDPMQMDTELPIHLREAIEGAQGAIAALIDYLAALRNAVGEVAADAQDAAAMAASETSARKAADDELRAWVLEQFTSRNL